MQLERFNQSKVNAELRLAAVRLGAFDFST